MTNWHYNELLKTLIILSLSSDYQIEIAGVGDPNVEITEDFKWHYVQSKNDLIALNLLNVSQTDQLDKIANLIDQNYNHPENDFWNYECLDMDQDWIEIRKIAKGSLSSLNATHLTLKVFIENKYEKSKGGEKLVIQNQKIELINKDSH